MAISLIQEPQVLQPGYNLNYWSFSSTNKALLGFRYIIDVYNSNTDAMVFRQRVNPSFTNGNGIIELSKILSTFLTNDLPTVTNPNLSSNIQYTYYIKVGEEYATNWEYYDYVFNSSAGIYNGYVILTSNHAGYMQTHSFLVGDQILITQDDPDIIPGTLLLEGLHTIVEIIDEYSFVIDIPFVYVGSTVPGTATGSVTYADGRKTIFPNLYTSTDKIVFNGGLTYPDFKSWSYALYDCSVNTDKLITDSPRIYTVGSSASVTINTWMQSYAQVDNYKQFLFVNNLGTNRVCNANISTEHQQLVSVGVGPGNMATTTLISGSGQIIQPGTIWYYVVVINDKGVEISERIYYYLDTQCTSYTKHELVFLDRMGALGSFTFNYDIIETGAITKTTNNYLLGTLATGWSSATTDGITRINDVNIKEKIKLNTAWLSDAEALYFTQLLSSPVTFLKIGSYYYAVTVDETSYEIKKKKTNKNIKYSVTVSISNNRQINW